MTRHGSSCIAVILQVNLNVTFFEIIPFVYDIDTISGNWAWKASFNEQLVVTELFGLGAKVVLHFK